MNLSKDIIVCPVCKEKATLIPEEGKEGFYKCFFCGFDSHINTLDISYKNPSTSALSNLFPHQFVIDGIKCSSMENFIQSLREENVEMQKSICSDYQGGLIPYKMRLCLRDWRQDGVVYWQGKTIDRYSDEYTSLLSKAYDCLFEQNIVFREIFKRFKDMQLIHSIGCDDIHETLLTEEEYRFQLNRLKDKLK